MTVLADADKTTHRGVHHRLGMLSVALWIGGARRMRSRNLQRYDALARTMQPLDEEPRP